MLDNKKEVLLKHYKFKKSEGFVMDYDKPEDTTCLSVFISKKEWFEKAMEGAKKFYWNNKVERMLDLEEAWDYLLEDLWDELNFDNEAVLEEYLENKYAKIVNKLNELKTKSVK